MSNVKFNSPKGKRYDVVIVGGAIYGSAVAWFLTQNEDFEGSILVVEMDPTYEFCSTTHTNSCIRQQFSQPINIKISQFGAKYIKNFRSNMYRDSEIQDLRLQSYGYMYLAADEGFAEKLKAVQKIQAGCRAKTRHMSAEEIKVAYPFYNVEDIVAGNHNLVDEGYFEGHALFESWKKGARLNDAEFCTNRVVKMDKHGPWLDTVTLETGDVVSCGYVVNASGPRAALTAQMAGIEIPVEPRKRFTFIFDAEKPLDRDLPLTIDPSGIHVRTDGHYYLAGCAPEVDVAVEPDDFEMDNDIWEEKVWPVLAHRIPQFDALKLVRAWAGHYAYNTFDQNAIIGPHTDVKNFLFINGFSGHGLQQSPAMARGLAERIVYGEYRSLDLSPFSYERLEQDRPFLEEAVI